jgi:hypothetical protein
MRGVQCQVIIVVYEVCIIAISRVCYYDSVSRVKQSQTQSMTIANTYNTDDYDMSDTIGEVIIDSVSGREIVGDLYTSDQHMDGIIL